MEKTVEFKGKRTNRELTKTIIIIIITEREVQSFINCIHTVPTLWRLFSSAMDTKMKTVQTAATAHVGVWSRSLELLLLSPAAMAKPPKQSHENNTEQNSFLNLELYMGEKKKKKTRLE